MKATNNTIINSIMRTYMKYICAIVMVLGVSVNAWGGITFSPSSVSVTISEDDAWNSGDGIDVAVVTISGSSLYQYGTPYWVVTGITSGENSDYWYETYPTGESFGTTSFSTDVTIYITAIETGTFAANLVVYYQDESGSYKSSSIPISVTVSADITTYDVTFNEGSGNTLVVGSSGVNSSTKKISTASMSVLPTATPCDPASDAGWVFDGWKAGGTVSNGSTSYTKVTTPYVPTADVTLYAVYKKKNEELSSSTEYTLQSSLSDLSTSYWMMSCCSDASTLLSDDQHRATNSSPYVILPTSGTYSSSKMTSDAANAVWLITEVTTGIYTFYNVQAEKYLAATATDKELILTTTLNNYAKWSMSGSGDYRYVLNQGRTNAHLHFSAGAWKCTEKASPSSEAYRVRFWKQSKSTIDAKMGTTYQSALSCTETYRVYYEVGCDEEEITSGSIPVDDTEYEEDVDVAVADNTLTRLGYTFAGWLSSYNGNTYDYNSVYGDNSFAIGNEDVTLTAQWEANTTTITLNKNCATGSNGTATVKYDATALATKTDATNSATGYHLEGYYTNDETPVKILTSTGAFANSTISGYVTSGKWSYTTASTLTLYAHWELNTHSLHWYKNDEGADDLTGSYTDGNAIEYGATITAPNTPTFTGHTFEGWSTTSSGSTTDPETSMPDEDLEYYAIWSLNSHKVSVASPANITIKATPSGESAIEEGGSNASVDYGTSVTLSYTGLSAGYAINRWKVTKDDDGSDVTASCVDGSTLTMPDYDVTVDVILYAKAKMKTRCLEFDVEGNVWLTSYAGVEVYTTDAPENRITITCTDWGDADRMYVSYYNGAGELVAKASSLFRVCDASTYNKVDATNNYFSISGTTHASGVKYVISYNPGASRYDQEDTWTIRFTAQSGASTILGYKDLVVHGRALPEYFAIASKFNNKWYALPNTILRNNSAITPIEIIVNNTTTPTAAVYAPTTVKYKGGARYAAGSNRYGISILAPNDSILKIRKNSNYVYVSKQGSTMYQDWCLQSTDFGAYTMWVPSDDSDNAPSKMGIYGGNIGYYKSPTSPSEQIYLLPITNELTPNDASVTEWGQKSVILDVDAQSPIVSAQAFFGDRASAEVAASLAQTRTSVKGSASKYNYTLTFSTLDFSDHKGELLYIDWLNSSDAVVSTSSVSIPWIIAESTTMGEISAVQNYWKDWEVHVLPGVTLEADGNSFSSASNTAKVRSLEIYPGATVKVTSGTLDVSQDLVLRNGWTRAGEKDYEVARLYIGSASLTTNRVYSDWYIDFDQYYPIAVPWDVTVANMSYKNTTGAVSVGPGNSNSVRLRYYDGNSRATNVQEGVGSGANWKLYGDVGCASVPTTLTPSHGYAMTARRPTGKAFSIIRMPLTIPSSDWTTGGEKGVVGTTHKDTVKVTAYGVKDKSETAYAEGWNFIANPYMALHQGELAYDDESEDVIEYANVPDINFKEYDQVPIDVTKLKPSSGFLVQAPKSGTVTFGAANRKASAPSYRQEPQSPKASKQKAYIVLSNEKANDMMGLLISDIYTAEYELNADLEKILSDGNTLRTYMRYNDMNMAYVAINSVLAEEWIPVSVRFPETGEYTFSMHEASKVDELEYVYLIDYDSGDLITNLLDQSYTFYSAKGTFDYRFAINAKVGRRDTPTDIDITDAEKNSDKAVKFLYREKLYILRNDRIYDATGKQVKGGAQ